MIELYNHLPGHSRAPADGLGSSDKRGLREIHGQKRRPQPAPIVAISPLISPISASLHDTPSCLRAPWRL